MKFPLCLCFIVYLATLKGQNGIQLNTQDALPSYTLFETQELTYLIDNCGDIVNEWNVRNTDNHTKLLPNGDMIYIKSNRIFVKDWDDNLVSETRYNANDILLEYEVIVLENGNYLCIARQRLDLEEFDDLGYNIIGNGFPRFMDMVVEIDPNTEEIVWQWNIKDHMVQQRNSQSNNYGLIKDNPRKLDMDAISKFDWTNTETFMINGFDYNPDLDLIALSMRKVGEVIIIDHSTTTEEAKSDAGGQYGHGGDILFRWGNPENYERGDSLDRFLYFQHNPNWIEHGEHKGKIMIFNNGLSARNYSSVEIIDPTMDSNNDFVLPENDPFELNSDPISINERTTGTRFFSEYTSGAKVLPNGNIYVTIGQNQRLFEMTLSGEIVWEYFIENAGYIFRSVKYPLTFSGFEGKDLTPRGPLEFPPSTYNCQLFSTSTSDYMPDTHEIKISQNDNQLFVSSKEGIAFDLSIFDPSGKLIFNSKDGSFYNLNKTQLNIGHYIIHTTTRDTKNIQMTFIH